MLLTGDPGIGKSRLAAEIARRAHEAGAFVLAGRSPEEALVPYQPFVEALRHYFLGVPSQRAACDRAREYGSELARLVPELRRRAPELPPPLEAEPETERYRLFEAVVGLLTRDLVDRPGAARARRPAVGGSPDAAAAAPPRAGARPVARVLVLGAYRATEARSGGFTDALAELRRERLVTQIEVRGLARPRPPSSSGCAPGDAATRRSATRCTRRPRATRSSSRRSSVTSPRRASRPTRPARGCSSASGLPEGVKDVIARRLTRLDSQAMEWLRVAAVIGRDFDAGLVEQRRLARRGRVPQRAR